MRPYEHGSKVGIETGVPDYVGWCIKYKADDRLGPATSIKLRWHSHIAVVVPAPLAVSAEVPSPLLTVSEKLLEFRRIQFHMRVRKFCVSVVATWSRLKRAERWSFATWSCLKENKAWFGWAHLKVLGTPSKRRGAR